MIRTDALLEQELKVQKMMMEVDRRDAIVREQPGFSPWRWTG